MEAAAPALRVVVLDRADVALEERVIREGVGDLASVVVEGLNLGSDEEARACPALPSADVVIMWHTLHADAALLSRMTAAKAIVRVGVGYDNINLPAAGAAGIPVCNVPDYGTEEVADHTLTLLLTLARRMVQVLHAVDAGVAASGSEGVKAVAAGTLRLRGMKLGLVGCGRIGTAVALRAKAFGLEVAYYDPFLPAGVHKALGIAVVEDLNTLLEWSDVLSFHVNLNPSSRHMLNSDNLKRCKRGVLVINTSRGGVIDEHALAEALKSGHVGGAGIDVHELEPYTPTAAQPLHGAPRCVCTPHTAFYSDAGYEEMRTKCALQAVRALKGVPVTNVVNAAEMKAAGVTPRTPIADVHPPK